MITTERDVFLYTFDKHTPESHSADHSARGLKLPQQAAVEAAVRMHPMASATDVRRNLNLADKKRRDEVYISPSKKRTLQATAGGAPRAPESVIGVYGRRIN